jgi:hypothetical protein
VHVILISSASVEKNSSTSRLPGVLSLIRECLILALRLGHPDMPILRISHLRTNLNSTSYWTDPDIDSARSQDILMA